MELLSQIPVIFLQFVVVVLFSLLIGLEQRRLENQKKNPTIPFGTDRTFAFIGLLGFMMYIADPVHLSLFILGACILSVLFGIYYYKKIELYKAFGITKILVGLITYSLAPIVITQPKWFTVLIVVSVLLLVESKNYFIKFSNKFANDEFVTLAKFLIISGVILPILPQTPISDTFNISPYQIWLSLVVVSGISYFSYLLQKFVVRKSGLLVSGILGGIYSSTATTLILSRKSKDCKPPDRAYASAILLATAMMYLRVFVLMVIFNPDLAEITFIYLLILFLILIISGLAVYFSKPKAERQVELVVAEKNPLELKLSVLFAALFLLFSFLTDYSLRTFGETGLNVLSYIVGFADIDPFLLNLFQGKFPIDINFIARVTFQAIVANNILKIIATLFLADSLTKKIVFAGLGLVTIVNLIFALML